MKERILDITTLGAPAGLPTLVRVAEEERCNDGYHCRPGDWPFEQVTVQITLEGCGACWAEGGGAARSVPVGSALLYANRLHRHMVYGQADRVTRWRFLYINLRGEAASVMIRDLVALAGPVVPFPASHPVIAECLSLLPRRGHAHRPWALAKSTSLAQQLLLGLCPASESETVEAPASDDLLIRRAMSAVSSRLDERWEVARLARELGVSREHLTRVFAQRLGQPPATWLRRQRVAQAAQQLRGGDSVADIGRRCGFIDAAHFARIFRQWTGLTPSVFRQRGGLPGW